MKLKKILKWKARVWPHLLKTRKNNLIPIIPIPYKKNYIHMTPPLSLTENKIIIVYN